MAYLLSIYLPLFPPPPLLLLLMANTILLFLSSSLAPASLSPSYYCLVYLCVFSSISNAAKGGLSDPSFHRIASHHPIIMSSTCALVPSHIKQSYITEYHIHYSSSNPRPTPSARSSHLISAHLQLSSKLHSFAQVHTTLLAHRVDWG